MTEEEKNEYDKKLLNMAKKNIMERAKQHIQTTSDSKVDNKSGLDKYLELDGKEEPIIKK